MYSYFLVVLESSCTLNTGKLSDIIFMSLYSTPDLIQYSVTLVIIFSNSVAEYSVPRVSLLIVG